MVRSYSNRASDHRVSRLKTYLPSCSTGACSSPNCWTTEAKRSSFSFGSLRIFTGTLLYSRESAQSDYKRKYSESKGTPAGTASTLPASQARPSPPTLPPSCRGSQFAAGGGPHVDLVLGRTVIAPPLHHRLCGEYGCQRVDLILPGVFWREARGVVTTPRRYCSCRDRHGSCARWEAGLLPCL